MFFDARTADSEEEAASALVQNQESRPARNDKSVPYAGTPPLPTLIPGQGNFWNLGVARSTANPLHLPTSRKIPCGWKLRLQLGKPGRIWRGLWENWTRLSHVAAGAMQKQKRWYIKQRTSEPVLTLSIDRSFCDLTVICKKSPNSFQRDARLANVCRSASRLLQQSPGLCQRLHRRQGQVRVRVLRKHTVRIRNNGRVWATAQCQPPLQSCAAESSALADCLRHCLKPNRLPSGTWLLDPPFCKEVGLRHRFGTRRLLSGLHKESMPT